MQQKFSIHLLLLATYDQFPDLSLLAEGLIICN